MTHLIINLISGQISSSLSPPSFGSDAPRDALRMPGPRRPRGLKGLVTTRFSPIYQLIGKIGLPILGVCWHFLVARHWHTPPNIKIPRSGHVLQETQTPQGCFHLQLASRTKCKKTPPNRQNRRFLTFLITKLGDLLITNVHLVVISPRIPAFVFHPKTPRRGRSLARAALQE